MSQSKSSFSLLFLTAIFSILLFVQRPGSWLFDPDEARYAEIPQSMLLSGEYVTPRLNGSHYFEKPPLLYWLNALSFKFLGPTPFAARLPVRCATWFTALALFVALKEIKFRSYKLTPFIFLSSMFPFFIGRINITDGIVSFGISVTLLAAYLFFKAREENASGRVWLVWIGVGASIGVLSKGLIGIVLPGLVLFIWSVFIGEGKRLVEIFFSRATVIFIFITVPWFVVMEIRNPGFSYIFFVREHLMRYMTNEANRTGSFFYFVPVFVMGLLPWSFFFFATLISFFPIRIDAWRAESDKLFFTSWVVIVILFFSVSRSKLIPYIFPAFPPAAVLIGEFVSEPEFSLQRWLKMLAVSWSVLSMVGIVIGFTTDFFSRTHLAIHGVSMAFFGWAGCWVSFYLSKKKSSAWLFSLGGGWAMIYIVLIGAVPLLAKDYSLHDMAMAAGKTNSTQVIAYGSFPHSFPFVLKKPVPVVDYLGELATDGDLSPELFWTKEKFWSVWNSSQCIVVVYRKNRSTDFSSALYPPQIIFENRKFYLSKNH